MAWPRVGRKKETIGHARYDRDHPRKRNDARRLPGRASRGGPPRRAVLRAGDRAVDAARAFRRDRHDASPKPHRPQTVTAPVEAGTAPPEAAHPEAGRPAELTWRALGPLRIADHTFVPPEMRGRGVAQQLVEALVADARQEGFKIVPECSYVAALFRRHPEWSDLLAEPDS